MSKEIISQEEEPKFFEIDVIQTFQIET